MIDYQNDMSRVEQLLQDIEKLKEENKLLRARTEALESQKDIKKLYEDALAAMSEYRGNDEIYED